MFLAAARSSRCNARSMSAGNGRPLSTYFRLSSASGGSFIGVPCYSSARPMTSAFHHFIHHVAGHVAGFGSRSKAGVVSKLERLFVAQSRPANDEQEPITQATRLGA